MRGGSSGLLARMRCALERHGRRGGRAGAVSGDEGVLSGGLRVLLVVFLFQQQVGACKEKGVRRFLSGDDGHGVMKLRGETAKHVDHLRCVAHRLAQIAKTVGEALEMAGVRGDVHVTLY